MVSKIERLDGSSLEAGQAQISAMVIGGLEKLGVWPGGMKDGMELERGLDDWVGKLSGNDLLNLGTGSEFINESGIRMKVEEGDFVRGVGRGIATGAAVLGMAELADGFVNPESPVCVPAHLVRVPGQARKLVANVEKLVVQSGLDGIEQVRRAGIVTHDKQMRKLTEMMGMLKAGAGEKVLPAKSVTEQREVALAILRQMGIGDQPTLKRYLSGESDGLQRGVVHSLAKASGMMLGIRSERSPHEEVAGEIVRQVVKHGEVIQAYNASGMLVAEIIKPSPSALIGGMKIATLDAGVGLHVHDKMIAESAWNILNKLSRGSIQNELGAGVRARAGLLIGSKQLDQARDNFAQPVMEHLNKDQPGQRKSNNRQIAGRVAGIAGLVGGGAIILSPEIQPSTHVAEIDPEVAAGIARAPASALMHRTEEPKKHFETATVQAGSIAWEIDGQILNQLVKVPGFEESTDKLAKMVDWDKLERGAEQANAELARLTKEMGQNPGGVAEASMGLGILGLAKDKRTRAALLLLVLLSACNGGGGGVPVVETPTYAMPGIVTSEAGGAFPADINWIRSVNPFDEDHIESHADQVARVAQNSVKERWGEETAGSMQFWEVTQKMSNNQEVAGGMMGVFQDKFGNAWVVLVENADGSMSYLGRSTGSVREYLWVPAGTAGRWQIVSRAGAHVLFEMGNDGVVTGFLPLGEERESDWVRSPGGFGGGKALLAPVAIPESVMDLVRAGGTYDAERRVWQDTSGYDAYMLMSDGTWVFVGGEPTPGAVIDENGQILDANGDPIVDPAPTEGVGILNFANLERGVQHDLTALELKGLGLSGEGFAVTGQYEGVDINIVMMSANGLLATVDGQKGIRLNPVYPEGQGSPADRLAQAVLAQS